jgi:glycerol-3-phosphate acyltransferase PlsX
VVVTDGLVGNVIIKLSEGLFSFITKYLKRQFTGGLRNKVGLALMLPAAVLALPGLALLWPSAQELRKRVDWRETGGAPLLGVNGVVVIGHGRSDEKAIRSMIRMAEKTAAQNLTQVITAEMAQNIVTN